MLKVVNNNILLTRGDSGVFELSIKDEDDQAYDFSGDTVIMTVKKNCTDKTVVIQKTFEDGKVTFTPEDTAELPMGDYVYDVQLTHVEGSGDEAVTSVDTVITPHTFTIGAEVSW